MPKPPNGACRNYLLANYTQETDDCILWPYSKTPNGYGSIGWNGSTQSVHRVACRLAHGDAPTRLHEVAHSCGNRACFNQRHLRWATRSENQMDRSKHGTSNRGPKHGMSKLTEEEVAKTRLLLGEGKSQSEVEAHFNVTRSTIAHIAQGRTWSYADAAE